MHVLPHRLSSRSRLASLLALACLASACRPADPPRPAAALPAPPPAPATPRLAATIHEGERHFSDLVRLTQGGENAEAYWSWSGQQFIFQARRGDEACDRMRILQADGSEDRVVASRGAHTCGYFLPGDERIIFSSTMGAGDECPPPPDRSQGYVWAIHAGHDIWSAQRDGSDLRQLTTTPGYDAEATVGRDGRIVFTSVRDGDLDLYTMASDGTDVRRLTTTPGYDGGAFFSPDGSLIVYRAHHEESEAELAAYRELLARALVRPGQLEVWVMNADGSGQRPVTSLGHAAFAPYFTPNGKRIIFSSNHADPRGRNFDLWLVALDGTGLEQVTTDPSFDGFPMFSPDGRRLVFASNRDHEHDGETNVFVATWLEGP